ncbi:hypothetical protein V1517DRAFT_315260 [Lipomyces orientalis]|uniref:Uncharacterized protein n=1 Tax=Lipomyces orientalis TaxID=1233043 RepID=A0ACC3TVL0_9ASCO
MEDSIPPPEQMSTVPERLTVEPGDTSNPSSKRKRSDPKAANTSALTPTDIHSETNRTKRPRISSDTNNARQISDRNHKHEKRERRRAKQLAKKQERAARNSRLTIKATEWSYLKLEITLVPSSAAIPPPDSIDLITVYTVLQSALKRYLGIIGSSLHFDILHLSNLTVYLRVPSKDFSPFWAAISGYHVDANAASGFKIVDGCSKVGITIAKTSKFLNGVTGPPRKWAPATATSTE